MSVAPSAQQLTSLGWNKFNLPPDIRKIEKRYFYPEFVDFCHADETDGSCVRYVKHVNKDMAITLKENTVSFSIKELTLYLMPFRIALFSIHIEHETDSLNDCTSLLFSLRSIGYYSECHHEFIENAIKPFMEVFPILTGKVPESCSELIENGNKFRIFQIINSMNVDKVTSWELRSDKVLYELATLSKIVGPDEDDEYSASDAYLRKTIDKSKISVFRNWSGLALMDTFTIHSFDASERFVSNWTDDYFQMIYIHCVFQKSYLFDLNIRFRETMAVPTHSWKSKLQGLNIKHSNIVELVNEYESFEQKCCFHKISYNFLPLEIADAIDKGLEIKQEMLQLFKAIEKEKSRRDEANDKLVNTLLFCLSLLTLFSAIWDISCLLDQMYPYKEYIGDQTIGYRVVSLLLVVTVSFLLLTIYNKRKKS